MIQHLKPTIIRIRLALEPHTRADGYLQRSPWLEMMACTMMTIMLAMYADDMGHGSMFDDDVDGLVMMFGDDDGDHVGDDNGKR